MAEETIQMTKKALYRLKVVEGIIEKRLTQTDASRQLSVTVRQVKRLVATYRREGAAGLVSRRQGQPSNRRLKESLRETIRRLLMEHYSDFGPTLAREKLLEIHAVNVSIETVRKLQVELGTWRPKGGHVARPFQMRERRPRFGELIQIDGSPHAWFEERGPYCTLIVFIDDAMGRLTQLYFAPSETTLVYMKVLRRHLVLYGCPLALYSDRHGIFRINRKEPANGNTLTQFGRVLKELKIEAIHAHTPQAKGRVERANQTLQDRLVKEMRLRGINEIDRANAFMPEFIDDYNRRFSVKPTNPQDAHHTLVHSARELDLLLSEHSGRTLSKNLILQYQNTFYQIQHRGRNGQLRGAKVTVCDAGNGEIVLLYKGKEMPYKIYQTGEAPSPIEDEKTLNARMDQVVAGQEANTQNRPNPENIPRVK